MYVSKDISLNFNASITNELFELMQAYSQSGNHEQSSVKIWHKLSSFSHENAFQNVDHFVFASLCS